MSNAIKYNIIIVDDDQDILNLMAHYLKESSIHLQLATSAEECLKLIGLSTIHLVISDILMPGMNGLELTKRIQELYPDLSILVCSEGGSTDAKEIVASIVLSKALEFGAVHALKKPFSKKEFQATVIQVLEDRVPQQAVFKTQL